MSDDSVTIALSKLMESQVVGLIPRSHSAVTYVNKIRRMGLHLVSRGCRLVIAGVDLYYSDPSTPERCLVDSYIRFSAHTDRHINRVDSGGLLSPGFLAGITVVGICAICSCRARAGVAAYFHRSLHCTLSKGNVWQLRPGRFQSHFPPDLQRAL